MNTGQATQPAQTTSKYAQYTVKELKQMIKDNNVLTFNSCTKKADYIKALEDHDAYEQSKVNFQKWADNIGETIKKTNELKEKAENTKEIAKEVLDKLKQKENKTSEDYEKMISLYEHLLKLVAIKYI